MPGTAARPVAVSSNGGLSLKLLEKVLGDVWLILVILVSGGQEPFVVPHAFRCAIQEGRHAIVCSVCCGGRAFRHVVVC